MFKNLFSSPETTLGGIVVFLGLVFTQVGYLFDIDPLTNPDWGIIAAAVGALFTGIKARDNGVNSKKAGAE